ncbi:MAG: glycosyltransferase [Longimicrobiales bacterium]
MNGGRRILYVQYTNPANYPPLQHSSRMLAEDGWQVRFIGSRTSGADLAMQAHPSLTLRLLGHVPPGPLQKLHYAAFQALVVTEIMRWRPHWLYASDLWSCPAALWAARLGCRVVYHEHDEPASQNASIFTRTCLRARSRLASRAAACILPNESRRERFAEQHAGAHTITVWNCPQLQEVQEMRSAESGRGFVLHYHGNIGAPLVPETLLNALRLLPGDVRLRVFGYETIGSRGYSQHLRLRARNLGIEPRFELHGPVNRSALWPEMRRAAVGISLVPLSSTDANLEALAGASNKTFDYLAAGLALLICDRKDWTGVFGEFGAACNPGNAQSVAAALRRLYDDRAGTRARGEQGRQHVLQEWNYQHQFQPVKALLDG